ncbi:DUF4153 domain-containing protein [Sphingomonas sp. BT-65]|uniref:DUF4153 domain-containing protein n=1 Tax=Sphingomonas sp. BT-65 TaxID=2989821 RepID=UPI0022368136|nr:DUF4153 domain-containing protein [Sphingomonas sp. BT-65]MCW4460425.1 DUF4153 domain-containing protein [Sphingomonas sp. BT-65]
MTSRIEEQDERWPLLPVLLAGLGLATGLITHWIIGSDHQPQISALRLALLSFVSVSALIFGFVVERSDLRRSILFALGCGLVAALILYFNGATSGWSETEGWRVFSLALAIGIAAPLFQAGRESGFRPISYPAAHDHTWTNAVLWCLSWAFVAVTMLLSFLLAALFQLIGIDFLRDLLEKEWFWRALVGLAFGLGLALLREHSRIVALLRNVAMLVLGVLAPVLAIGLGLFLLALPFTGLQPLWEATKSTTPILLGCVVGALLLVNAVIGNGADDAPRNRVLRWAALVLALVIFPLAVIAQLATGLRIGQYGYTPERLWALTFVILATVVAVAYLVSVVRGRGAWAERVRPVNLNLAILTCAVALLLATPILSFNAISTRDQVARLESGQVAPDKFDWAALAFDFGEPGRAALAKLAASNNPAFRRIAADIAKKKSRWQIERTAPDPASRLAALDKRLRILPRAVALPPALREALLGPEACGSGDDRPCTLIYEAGARRGWRSTTIAIAIFPNRIPLPRASSRFRGVAPIRCISGSTAEAGMRSRPTMCSSVRPPSARRSRTAIARASSKSARSSAASSSSAGCRSATRSNNRA